MESNDRMSDRRERMSILMALIICFGCIAALLIFIHIILFLRVLFWRPSNQNIDKQLLDQYWYLQTFFFILLNNFKGEYNGIMTLTFFSNHDFGASELRKKHKYRCEVIVIVYYLKCFTCNHRLLFISHDKRKIILN